MGKQTIKAFICGCGHSGTTLVANILAAHDDVEVPLRETNLFRQWPWLAFVRYRKLLQEAEAAGKRALVEKSPVHIRFLRRIRLMVPGARFVIPVRDGRDVAASCIARYGQTDTGIDRWIRDNAIVAAERGKPDVHIFRYEDLIENPPREIEAICNFLDLTYSDQLLDYHKTPRLWFNRKEIRRGNGRDGSEHRDLRNWQVNQPIFDGRGRWRTELDATTIASFTDGPARTLMEEFGYLESIDPDSSGNPSISRSPETPRQQP